MKNLTKYFPSAVLVVIFILYIVLVRTVDVAPIGPAGTTVGFSGLNQAVASFTGVNMTWYKITDILGYVAILIGLVFAALGAFQLITRRSLLKVDKNILILGGLFIVLALLYVFFEKVIINYRPIIMPDATTPEASFPSSHTMLACTILGSVILILKDYVKNVSLRLVLQAIFVVMLLVIVCGRLFSGVHWFTDIVGGVLISAVLLTLFDALIDKEGEGAE